MSFWKAIHTQSQEPRAGHSREPPELGPGTPAVSACTSAVGVEAVYDLWVPTEHTSLCTYVALSELGFQALHVQSIQLPKL